MIPYYVPIIYCFVLVFLNQIQHSGPEVKWVDGGKPIFKVSTHLVSTVYTQVCWIVQCNVVQIVILQNSALRNKHWFSGVF